MSASALMSLGVRAMAANYAALQTTGHNIANANVAGYSRQQVELATAQGQFTGAGFFGHGVDVATVSRSHNEFLTRESANANSLSAMDSARLNQLNQLQNLFTGGENGLGHATTALFDSMVDLANQPGDLAARQAVLARAGDMAARFSAAGTALDRVQASVTAELTTAVADVNSLARTIASANQRIANVRGLGQPANDLLDERERLIARLSELVQVSRIDASDGTTGIFIAGGQRLVLGSSVGRLQVTQDPADPARSAVSMVEGSVARPLDANALGGGSIAGTLQFQNVDLADGRNLVGQLAAAVGGALNAQQQRGLSLQVPLGQVPASALFSMGPSTAIPNAANARDAVTGGPVGTVALTIVNAGALRASDYALRESTTTPGSWQLTRLSDGLVSTVNSGDVVDGMRIDISNAQAGDRFLLQPVTRAANGMLALLGDPRDVAAASPLLASTAAANTGTAAVASLAVTGAPLPAPGATAQITFTSDTGDYSWELRDAASNALLNSGSGTWQAGTPVPAPPQDINGFTLQLSGVPRSGDAITVAPTPALAVASNNGNALALLDLRDAGLSMGRSATETWAQALSNVGVRVQSGQSAADISGAVAGQAEQARSAQSGVNLDEEAARLIQYQQSYQAAAKVLQVAQALFDTLLQTAGA